MVSSSAIMSKDIKQKLWVIKFCLKVIYPNLNSTCFLVFLAVKYRRWCHRRLVHGCEMESYSVKPLSSHLQKKLIKDYLTHLMPVHLHKCFVISRDQFIQLAAENLFYIDNGILWVTVKLNPLKMKKIKEEKNRDKSIKYNLKFLQSDVHRKLLHRSSSSIAKHRIVPVIGSKYVEEGVALTTENELHNLIGSFGLDLSHNPEICFHPLLSCNNAPKIAGLAEVNLVLNDFDISNDFIKEILSNYFEIPKLVHQNDMFSIELTPEITAKYNYKYYDLVESVGKLYFKCNKLINDALNNLVSDDIDMPYFIVKGVTQLTLGEGIHEIKPKDKYCPLQDTNSFHTQLIELCPTGLKEKFNQIQETIAPFLTGDLNIISSSLSSPLIPMLLLTGNLGSGRHLLVKTLAKFNGLNCLQIDCNALQSSTAKQTEAKISATIQKAKTASPTIVLLDNFEVFAVDAENNEDCRVIEYFSNSLIDLYENYTKHTIIFIAITEVTDLKPNIQRIFLEKFHIPKLNVNQRYEMLKWFIAVMNINIGNHENNDDSTEKIELIFENNNIKLPKITDEVLQRVAAKTETFVYGDLDTLVHFVLRESYLEQLNKSSVTSPDPQMNLIQEEHFNCAIESMRRLQSHQLDAPKIPKVYWEDIGGLDGLKKELLKTIEFPIKYPHLFKNSALKRSGILLYGPPGCGKTLVAKAVSTELNVSFLSVKGPELLNMYIGQSEENVRRVFRAARSSSPCIVFLDELDALAARRGAAADSGGAADRLVSQLLAELDGVHAPHESDTSSFVFVMGATNRPDLIEQSLLRPGRLDKLIYVGPYCGQQEKISVLTALCRSVTVQAEVSLPAVARALPPRVTGADLLRVVATARTHALRGLVADIRDGKVKESELSPSSVVIGVSEMWKGVENFRPSVSDEELAYYESLQSQM